MVPHREGPRPLRHKLTVTRALLYVQRCQRMYGDTRDGTFAGTGIPAMAPLRVRDTAMAALRVRGYPRWHLCGCGDTRDGTFAGTGIPAMAPLRVRGYPRWHLCGYGDTRDGTFAGTGIPAMAPLRVPGCLRCHNGKTSTGPDAWSLSGLLSCDDTRRQRGQCDQNRGLRKAPPGRGRRPRARPRPHTGYGSRGPGVAAHPPTPLPRRVPPADSLRAALGIYEDRRANALADRVRASLASLTAQPGRAPA